LRASFGGQGHYLDVQWPLPLKAARNTRLSAPMLMTANLLMGLSALVLATSFIAGVLGLAGGMILMGVLLVFLPVPTAMVLHAVTQMSANGWRALLWWKHIRWRIFGRYSLGLATALALFTAIRLIPDRAVVLLLLGATPFVVWLLPDHRAPRADRPGGAETCGLICMALQLLSGVSGPALDVFFVKTSLDRRVVVATKASCQVITHLSRLVYFGGVSGIGTDLGWPILVVSVSMAIIGTSLSRVVLEHMTDVQFRRWTQRIVMMIGAVYLAQGAYALVQG
jgi:uncharacterized membrane protein YfcA